MTHHPFSRAAPGFRFSSLPVELRCGVYKYLLPNGPIPASKYTREVRSSSRPRLVRNRIGYHLAIQRVNRFLYVEASGEFYKQGLVVHIDFHGMRLCGGNTAGFSKPSVKPHKDHTALLSARKCIIEMGPFKCYPKKGKSLHKLYMLQISAVSRPRNHVHRGRESGGRLRVAINLPWLLEPLRDLRPVASVQFQFEGFEEVEDSLKSVSTLTKELATLMKLPAPEVRDNAILVEYLLRLQELGHATARLKYVLLKRAFTSPRGENEKLLKEKWAKVGSTSFITFSDLMQDNTLGYERYPNDQRSRAISFWIPFFDARKSLDEKDWSAFVARFNAISKFIRAVRVVQIQEAQEALEELGTIEEEEGV
ncbi:hypothetical protein EJ08DRAFT_291430 [Tothia fuscella]|uniref:Uncharacterized protein n=1 Tax=Tothia fuscella TaxID=1048955 RepID=A0A9P4P200_9PEZI|nr:hypothetical protein EJ08DRAFT_291430 [Tothia fuscella]